MSNYTDYDFHPFLREAIQQLGFTEPTPIQKELIPLILKGKSAIGQAHTGTGKSHSFLIPIVQRINPADHFVQAVIIAPTRELAAQLTEALQQLIEHSQIRIASIIGGEDRERAANRLKTTPHIVIGTPGRLRVMADEQLLDVHRTSILVVDEADLAFDMGFIEEIDQVASRMPQQLEMYVFSATIPEKLKPFLTKYMSAPVHIKLGEKRSISEGIHYSLVPVRGKEKEEKLLETMKGLNPYLAIIFTNTRLHADRLANYLSHQGIKVGRIHGDLTSRERTKMMKRVRDLEFEYIVATDLAARGIDIPGVSHVINFEIPDDLEFFIHRVGRTARAGLEGHAITLYTPDDEQAIAQIESFGVPFVHEEVKNGQWVAIKERHARKKRVKQLDDIDRRALASVRKPKKVKPGYKKKMAKQVEAFKKRERRIKRRNEK